jgi:hypothetical protein
MQPHEASSSVPLADDAFVQRLASLLDIGQWRHGALLKE